MDNGRRYNWEVPISEIVLKWVQGEGIVISVGEEHILSLVPDKSYWSLAPTVWGGRQECPTGVDNRPRWEVRSGEVAMVG